EKMLWREEMEAGQRSGHLGFHQEESLAEGIWAPTSPRFLSSVDSELTLIPVNFIYRSESRDRQRDTDVLLRALIEAEIDGVAVANQLTALKETTDNLTKEKRLSKLHAASLGRQQDLLLEKIEMFDRTNHSLRDLLRDWSAYEDNVRTTEELSRILESTRSCLESQLNQAEVEKVQLASQIQNQDQQREELQVLQGELQTLRQQKKEEEEQREEEQESHALITQRAQRAEESSRQLAEKLQEKVRDGSLTRCLNVFSRAKISTEIWSFQRIK
ncbi:hypothetical protein GOODEAATRI_016433, partial [Goodea atripinnis]